MGRGEEGRGGEGRGGEERGEGRDMWCIPGTTASKESRLRSCRRPMD